MPLTRTVTLRDERRPSQTVGGARLTQAVADELMYERRTWDSPCETLESLRCRLQFDREDGYNCTRDG